MCVWDVLTLVQAGLYLFEVLFESTCVGHFLTLGRHCVDMNV